MPIKDYTQGPYGIESIVDGLESAESDIKQAQSQLGAMTGVISSFAATAAPEGWLKANGAELLRDDYPELWDHAQASGNLVAQASKEVGNFGDGDGSTTFTIPDIRGEFIRGFDDGRGADSGRAIGSSQSHGYESHTHDMTFQSISGSTNDRPLGSYGIGFDDGSGGAVTTAGYGPRLRITGITNQVTGTGDSDAGFIYNPSGRSLNYVRNVPNGISETRPRNVALLYCIKY